MTVYEGLTKEGEKDEVEDGGKRQGKSRKMKRKEI